MALSDLILAISYAAALLQADNRAAFGRYRLLPRMLRDVSALDLRQTLLGMELAAPILVAPMAMHGLAHEDKELATARACAAQRIPFVLSTLATSSIEETAWASKHEALIFQLYVIRNRSVVLQWVRQAETTGYKALMVCWAGDGG